jgi:CHAD domain-containing protein
MMQAASAPLPVNGRKGGRASAIRRALAVTTHDAIGNLPWDASAARLVGSALAAHTLDLLHYEVLIRLRADPEDVHRARSSVRKLRAILRGFRPFLERVWADTLREELRWLAGELGSVRDVDVALEALRSCASSVSDDDASHVAATLEPLAATRKDALAGLELALDSSRYRELLDAIESAAQQPKMLDGVSCAGDTATAVVRKTAKRTRKAVQSAHRDLTASELHHARIQVRNGRYIAEATESVLGKPARKLARRLSRMQDVLGALNDATFVQERLRSTLAGDPRTSLVAGQMIALQAAEGAKARKAWSAIRRRALRDGWIDVG